MRGLIKPCRDEEEGATLAIVAVALIALMGMVVLVVDVGGLVSRRRELVNANDSAALAAAKAFALNENGADCGVNEGPAEDFATTLAAQNVDAPNLTLFDPNCADQTVTVEYDRQQDLFFAPVLGFGDTTTVSATATARWGQAMGGNPVPIELDPGRTNQCVFLDENDPEGGFKPPGQCPEGYWFDPQETDQNSAWGLLSLNEWAPDNGANDPQAQCSAAGGTNDLGGWIDGSGPVEVTLAEIPTYVCTRNGASTSSWLGPLQAQACPSAPNPDPAVCRTLLFPINDPNQMVVNDPWLPSQIQASSTNREKYAIVAFAPMQVVAVFDGDSVEAIGTPGIPAQNVDCDVALNLSVADEVNLGVRANQECNAPLVVDAIPYTSVQVYSGNGRNRVNFNKCPPIGGANCDYRYDETSYDLTWVNAATRGGQPKNVIFTWVVNAIAGTTGACNTTGTAGVPPSSPPSRAFCLVLAWAGPQLIGQDPGPPGAGFGAQAITLIK
jgi:Flp pilus assembly protein TadG